MAAASLCPGKKNAKVDVGEYHLPETHDQIPPQVMEDLSLPGYTWLYLTASDPSSPARDFIFTTERPGQIKASGARSDQAKWQAGGDRGGHTEISLTLSSEEREKYKFYTASGVSPKLPHILMTNARSLQIRVEDLKERIKDDKDIQSCDIMCFTETWLRAPPSDEVEGYRQEHCPRDREMTGKKRGGGLGVLIKNGVNATVIMNQVQTLSYQIMGFIYESEGTPPTIFLLVYIQPEAPRPETRREIETFYKNALDWYNGGPVFILGDFNWYDVFLNSTVVEQYVTCPTRKDKILDKCYGNVRKAYSSKCKRPLQTKDKKPSDHNVILLISDPKHDRRPCSHSQWSV